MASNGLRAGAFDELLSMATLSFMSHLRSAKANVVPPANALEQEHIGSDLWDRLSMEAGGSTKVSLACETLLVDTVGCHEGEEAGCRCDM